MNRYALIDLDGHIVQLFAWDGETPLVLPEGFTYRPEQEGDVVYVAPTVPQSITPRQARLALNAAGLREDVETAVVNAGRDAQDYWEYALEIERDNPLLVALSSSIGITPEQLDELFVAAATL